MDKKNQTQTQEENSLLTDRFAPGENEYLNDNLENNPSSVILNEMQQTKLRDEKPGEDFEFLYWQ